MPPKDNFFGKFAFLTAKMFCLRVNHKVKRKGHYKLFCWRRALGTHIFNICTVQFFNLISYKSKWDLEET